MSGVAPIVQNKPVDDAFHQQRLKTWQPILSPMNVIIIFLIIGVSFIPAGVGLMQMSDAIFEQKFQYDGVGAKNEDCKVDKIKSDTPKHCSNTFQITQDVDKPLHVYYELENFYQNHRMYVKSQSTKQLLDTLDTSNESDMKTLKEDSCENMATYIEPTTKVEKLLWPCGLIAQSYFNDQFKLTSASLNAGFKLNEDGIAWESDYDKFKNPDGFKYAEYDSAKNTCENHGLPSDCKSWPLTGTTKYKYWYPDFDKRQYIFQTYPQINPIKGLNDEHFMIWMRTAALPKFRKIYGTIAPPKGGFKKGDTIEFSISSSFEVRSYNGKKSLVISTISDMGGKNTYIGTAYLVVGSIAVLLTVLFIIKHLTSDRRKLGDTNLLRWDD
jgi:hypothetical protein